ncbi:hypothetical protein, partial [Nocardioides sp.]|uniref:hypothetical protein n=1 Tax=Nocardioides sp. TaxID=35761 RepID=UPI00286DCB33
VGGSRVQQVRRVGSAGDTYDSTVQTAESWLTPDAGAKPERYPGGTQVFRIELVDTGSSFKVTDYRVLAK